MGEFLIIATVVVITLVGVLIYLLLGTVRAALASHKEDEEMTDGVGPLPE
jgi:hypothetical protein